MRLIKLTAQNSKEIVRHTIKVLRRGGLVVFPSDTVYGLLVDATNQDAVLKLLEFKERQAGKAISIFVSDMKMLKKIVRLNQTKSNLLDNILPGPFTVVLDYDKKYSKFKLSKDLLSEKNTIGLRYPFYFVINLLIVTFKKPITATSANLSGAVPAHSISAFLRRISKKKKDMLDLVVDGGSLPRNKPSTVIDFTSEKIKQLRSGDINLFGNFKYISKTPEGTKKIAKIILKENIKQLKNKSLVIILKGPLGAGKTVFVKGIGEYFGIKNIISPSFVIYYEYKIGSKPRLDRGKKLIHADLFNIKHEEELKYLGFEKYLKVGNIICIEWGEKSSNLIKSLASKSKLIYIDINYQGKDKRKINISSIGEKI